MKELSQSFFLSAGETNAEQEMSLPLLTAKIIDIATAHANMLGVGNPAMADLGAGWVLARLTIEMSRYPRVNDNYTLTTWVESWNRHFSERSFMLTVGGEVLGYARSIWMVMGTDSHRNIGLSHLDLPAGSISDRPCPIPRQAKHLTITDSSVPVRTHTFGYCDLDAYRHVNTVRYVALLLNQFTLADMDACMVDRLEMSFLHEARYGTTVEVLRSDLPTTLPPTNTENPENPESRLISFLLRDTDGGEHLYARLRLRPRR